MSYLPLFLALLQYQMQCAHKLSTESRDYKYAILSHLESTFFAVLLLFFRMLIDARAT
jgi:hypothetical protein